MTRNLGGLDRLVRFYLGLILVGFALPYWAPQTSWNWVGWVGALLMLSSVAGSCALYRVVGLSTRPRVA